MRTISHKDLPNADLSTVGIIPLSNLFPLEATYGTGYPSYIHYDGNLVRFFELDSVDSPSLSQAIKALDYDMSMQIYRYHTLEKEYHFLSVTKNIDYSGLIPNHIFKNFSINPITLELSKISELTSVAYATINHVVSNLKCRETDYLQSPIPHILFDFDLRSGVIHGSQVRTNFSFLKIGDAKYGTIASLNNMSHIPCATRCTSKHTYLERILLVCPSKEQRTKLQYKVLDNANLIEHLTEKKNTDYSIDTLKHGIDDIMPTSGKILYSDITFFLFSDSMNSLTERFQSFYDCMEQNDIALYCHTNTSRRTYISLFPGNEVYGERYTLMFEYFLNILMSKALEL